MSEQIEFFDIPSPCIRVCQTDAKGLCMGCFRNRDERFKWLTYNDAEKRDVIRLTRQRYMRFVRGQRALSIPITPINNADDIIQLSLFDEE